MKLGSAGTLVVTSLEVFVPVPSLPSIEALLVVGADRKFVAAGEGLFFADGEFGGAGGGDAFAVGVCQGARI